jgi:hypothetical protein
MLGERRFGKFQTVALAVIALVMGASLISPAVAHFRPSLGHLIKHFFKKADPRYVNTTEAAGGDLSGPHGNLQIKAKAVGAGELGNAIFVQGTGVAVAAGTSAEATVTCPAGTRLLSGGPEWQSDLPGTSIIYSVAIPPPGDANTTWVVKGRVAAAATNNVIYAEALCLEA